MTCGSEVKQTVEVPPCQYIDRSVGILVEMQRQTLGTHRKLIAPHAWQLARVWHWVPLRRRVTCLSLLVKAQRRPTTLEDASEFDLSEWELFTEALGSPVDPSLFDLTKAMVDPELNAEFSLCAVMCPLLLATGELPCSRLLHMSAKQQNMRDSAHSEMDDGAGADVFVFENLQCPLLSTRMSTDNEDDPLTAKLVAENERLRAALTEARRENARLALQKTEHVDFAHLLKLAKEFGDGFGKSSAG